MLFDGGLGWIVIQVVGGFVTQSNPMGVSMPERLIISHAPRTAKIKDILVGGPT